MTPSLLPRTLCAALAAATLAAMPACTMTAYPENYADDGGYPPDDFVATTQPVYFEGHAAYWYGNHWYYRDGAHWRSYAHEPPALAQRRAQNGPPARQNYARPSVRASAPARGAPSRGERR
jgi:hypothetical protein